MAKSIIDKCDVAAIVSRPVHSEMDKINKILRDKIDVQVPNICMSIYKNRGGKYNNVKIWLYIDYSTMRVSDLFITDYDCQLREDIQQNYVHVTEDNIVEVFTDKDALVANKNKAIKDMSEVEDEIDDSSDFNKDKNEEENTLEKSLNMDEIEDESILNDTDKKDNEIISDVKNKHVLTDDDFDY